MKLFKHLLFGDSLKNKQVETGQEGIVQCRSHSKTKLLILFLSFCYTHFNLYFHVCVSVSFCIFILLNICLVVKD